MKIAKAGNIREWQGPAAAEQAGACCGCICRVRLLRAVTHASCKPHPFHYV